VHTRTHPPTHKHTRNTLARPPAHTNELAHEHATAIQVKEALATGALDVNDTDSKGDTLLHMAARNGHKAIVKEVRPRHAPAAVAECTRTS
jgi:ankyrin repeat protein